LQQNTVLEEMGTVFEGFAASHGWKSEVPEKCSQQRKLVKLHLLDIERMSNEAMNVNRKLTQTLDLKQKHANALEARFARDQAQDTARQGQTIMVFTIVTIIFLPLSFMAAFFAINITEFPHDPSNGGNGLPLGYVAKYMFGIGLGVSFPIIAIALVFGDVRSFVWTAKNWLRAPASRLSARAAISKAERQATAFGKPWPPGEDSNPIYRHPRRVWTDANEGTIFSDLEAG